MLVRRPCGLDLPQPLAGGAQRIERCWTEPLVEDWGPSPLWTGYHDPPALSPCSTRRGRRSQALLPLLPTRSVHAVH
jgi:hypothetical protein